MTNNFNFSLIVCTYMRANALLDLLNSVKEQTYYPNEIIIVDGSLNNETQQALEQNKFENLIYFKVDDLNRGLTKQRNFGISKVDSLSKIVCFLDDDTILEKDYFEQLLNTYTIYPAALGVGGYITNETIWEKATPNYHPKFKEYFYDGWRKMDGSRFLIRKRLGLDTNLPPCYMPEFSHGRSVAFLPPSGKIYQVEQLMGGVSSFKKEILDQYKFSTYFQGYGLYEDADYTFRLSKIGSLYLNTNAKLAHFHDGSGRPNKYNYGKMVLRNGWYVWRVKYPNPRLIARIKWNLIALLLTMIRFTNVFTTSHKKEAFTESIGRIVGWSSLLFNKPKIKQ
ncbi:glycosyltransferase family 2 protein [Flavobacterium sp. SUN052]|uniref:glycosyltransferase family 2 protein n=1 Tax=Flavobacterium sp. SUN052 TaxID=3002441 RepID=UPI00237E54E8|nr:glycosyltransferase family 2 protein [Flavobacterium sp. SUN052]MEC4004389.1 glycosyltransferase family 2 protein [Flavobacterium sp. SUN052]